VTVHESLARDALVRVINDPRATAALADVERRLSSPSGGLERWYVDAIGQVHMSTSSRWPMEQVAAFARVHAGLVAGAFGMIRIGGPHLEGGPGRDADRTGNASRLADLYGPFRAIVDLGQNNADDDGTLSWGTPARIERSAGASFINPCLRSGTSRIVMPVTVDPWSAPIEVGSTLPSRTLTHLVVDGAVARWPYGSDWITLFVNLEPYWTKTWLD
jgi:hypothetical protein